MKKHYKRILLVFLAMSFLFLIDAVQKIVQANDRWFDCETTTQWGWNCPKGKCLFSEPLTSREVCHLDGCDDGKELVCVPNDI